MKMRTIISAFVTAGLYLIYSGILNKLHVDLFIATLITSALMGITYWVIRCYYDK